MLAAVDLRDSLCWYITGGTPKVDAIKAMQWQCRIG
jgi:hypothetical protein